MKRKRRSKKTKPEPLLDELHRRFLEGDDFEPKPGDPLFKSLSTAAPELAAVESIGKAANYLARAIVALVRATIEAALEPVPKVPIGITVDRPRRVSSSDGRESTITPGPARSSTEIDGAGVQELLEAASAYDAAKLRGTVRISKGMLDLVRAIVQHEPDGITRRKLIILTGLSPSSFRTYMPVLKTVGFVKESGDRYYALNAGKQRIGSVPPLPTKEEALEHWLDTLPEGEATLLSVLAAAKRPLGKEELSLSSKLMPSSVRTYMPNLVARELVQKDQTGTHWELAKELRP